MITELVRRFFDGVLHGRLWYGAYNELVNEGHGSDAVKFRVAAKPGYAAVYSFDTVREDGEISDIAQIRAIANQDLTLREFTVLTRVDNTEQGMVYALHIARDQDNGNRLTLFSYLPVKYLAGQPQPAPLPPSPSPEPTPTPPPTEPSPNVPAVDYPHAIVMLQGCTGTIADLRTIGDDVKVRAVSPSLGVVCEVEITVTAPGMLKVEFIRNDGGSPAPYCYVYVDGQGKWETQLEADRIVANVGIDPGARRVRAVVSAQNGGSCHIGAILVAR